MNRTPPIAVRRELRREVGFGCPVPDCGNPYLYWHHFDPPWNEFEHHNPEGMIALCAEHHAKANVGAFTKEQMRQLKRDGINRAEEVRGRFDWMRHKVLAVVGGNFYYETPVIFEFRGEPAIWLNRDENGYLLLNLRMLTTSGEPRVRLEDNFWFPRGDPDDLDCPPSGKFLKVRYNNGDHLQIEFLEIESSEALTSRYPDARPDDWKILFPITVVEVYKKVGGTEIEFGPRETILPGYNVIRGVFMKNVRVGISLN